MTFFVGTGPTELHAHIDLDHRITATIQPGTTPAVTVLDVTCSDGHWAVLATLNTDITGKEPR
ncbi:hypothetical protein [Dietzia sp. Die43]|uniref:hypothetical protein n=1 Tax=Dietzia sp. Die43 TaxID=2926011 RepID=UPI00211833C0|nr:hypothetical protein [Dietzia sp. Die43]